MLTWRRRSPEVSPRAAGLIPAQSYRSLWGGGCSTVTTDPWACLVWISLQQSGACMRASFLARKTRGSEVRRRKPQPRLTKFVRPEGELGSCLMRSERALSRAQARRSFEVTPWDFGHGQLCGKTTQRGADHPRKPAQASR